MRAELVVRRIAIDDALPHVGSNQLWSVCSALGVRPKMKATDDDLRAAILDFARRSGELEASDGGGVRIVEEVAPPAAPHRRPWGRASCGSSSAD